MVATHLDRTSAMVRLLDGEAGPLVDGEPVEEKIAFVFLDVLMARADAAPSGAPV